jgi:hypothetical protein
LLLVKKRKGIDRRKNVNAQRFASYGQWHLREIIHCLFDL